MDILTIIILSLSLAVLIFYFVHMVPVAIGWGKLGKGWQDKLHGEETSISVVIAARNEAKRITRLLECLAKQDYPHDRMEVIIVDDRSRDRTFKLVERFIQERNLDNFRIISLRLIGLRGSKKNAIRYGVLDAKGELVVVTDADCAPGPGWLKAFSREFRAFEATMLAGPVLLEPLKGFAGAFQEMEFLSLVGSGAGATAAGVPVFCNGANMAFRRSAFSEVGGFKGNEKYASGDDVFLLHKIKKRYGARAVRFVYDREAVIYTKGKENWKEFLEQRIRWASKTRGYKDIFTITTAISVFLISLMLFLLLIAGLLKPLLLAFFGGLLVMKMLPDLVIMLGITGFAGRRRLMWWFPVFELAYIPYVLYTGVESLLSSGTWKGRKTVTRETSAPPKQGPPAL
jgi:poly-beta-1,6-N-acetyl-D-glucosamine synthase